MPMNARNDMPMHSMLAMMGVFLAIAAPGAAALDSERAVARTYAVTAPAPERQTAQDAQAKSHGLRQLPHRDRPHHHARQHRRDPRLHRLSRRRRECGRATRRDGEGRGLSRGDRQAHVLPRFPKAWNFPSSANPERSYTLLNREAPEFVRFVNPGDYRVAREACGACHLAIIQATERSLMATSAMLWGGASYNNGILPYKRYLLGEAYTAKGEPATMVNPVPPTPFMTEKGILAQAVPAAGVGDRSGRGHLPRVRARRPHDPEPVS